MSGCDRARAERLRRWHAARRVLAVRLDDAGDVLLTTPALAAIRHTLPDVHLALLASPAGAALAAHVPVLDQVIAFDAAWAQPERSDAAEGVWSELGQRESRLVDHLAEQRYDAAVIFTACTQSALPAAS